MTSKLLEGRVAVVYGAGAIGTAIARGFVEEGATVYLGSRSTGGLERAAATIDADLHPQVVDALDEDGVEAFTDSVVRDAGRLDVVANVIGVGDVQQPLLDIGVVDFLTPIITTMRSQFLTTRAAARPMLAQQGGVILSFGGSGPQTQPGLGGFKISLDALAGLRRQWACELGEHGIRVVTLKTGGILESVPEAQRQQVLDQLPTTMLRTWATLEDVGRVAAFAASDHARSMTSTELNISCGSIVE
jgi:3-oxoacyl-[acyl-carrier protein] reductase